MARLRTWALAALAVVMIAMLSGAPTGAWARSVDDTPPDSAPVVDDPCGTANDRYFIPMTSSNDYTYLIDGQAKNIDAWYPTGGKQSLTAEEVDGYDNVVAGPWTLTFTDTPCGKPVPNVYTVSVGACDTRSGFTQVVVHMKNPDDTSDQPITDPVLSVIRAADGTSPRAQTWPSVPDGQTVDGFPGQDQGGLLPGTQELSIFTNGERYRPEKVLRFFVPGPCGDEEIPAGDPGLAAQHRPTAKLTKVAPHRMQVTLNNKRVARATTFLLVVDPTRGATRQATVRVPAHTRLTGTCGATSPAAFKPLQAACITRTGTTYTVKAKPGTRWVRLAHNRI